VNFFEKLTAGAREFGAMGPGFYLAKLNPRRKRSMTPVHVRGVGKLYTRYKSGDMSIIRQTFGERQYDISSFGQQAYVLKCYDDLLSRNIKPLIIDAGANIGAASIWFAQLFPQAEIVAVEPDPGNAALCRTNTAAFPNITVCEAAIGALPGRVTLSNDSRKACAIETVRAGDGDVKITTIADIKAAAGPDRQFFIVKIDIEGFEEDLFSTQLDWLDEPCVVIVEPHDWLFPERNTSATFQSAMGNGKFQLLIKGENLIYVRNPNLQRS
jgi:FkbM family methyltransferase